MEAGADCDSARRSAGERQGIIRLAVILCDSLEGWAVDGLIDASCRRRQGEGSRNSRLTCSERSRGRKDKKDRSQGGQDDFFEVRHFVVALVKQTFCCFVL